MMDNDNSRVAFRAGTRILILVILLFAFDIKIQLAIWFIQQEGYMCVVNTYVTLGQYYEQQISSGAVGGGEVTQMEQN